MKIGKIEISVEEFKQLDEDEKKELQDFAGVSDSSSKKRKKKPSINGADVSVEPSIEKWENSDGVTCLRFKAEGYKTRSYPVEDLETAHELVEAKQFSDEHRKSGTKFVSVSGIKGTDYPYGENLVKHAVENGFVE